MRGKLEGVGAFVAYLAISLLVFGRVLGDLGGSVVGLYGGDQGFFAWSLVHWLEVLAGNQSPFLTDRIDAPMGFNLAWATTIPGPALLFAPLTALAGPLVTYNTLAIAAPAMAAWTAYLLCRHITQDSLAAILGGWIFGFSSYLLGQTLNHLNLALVAALPLIVLVVIRLVEQSIRPGRGVLALAGLIAMQFLIFTEVGATATVVGSLAILAAIAIGPSELRGRILRTLPLIVAGYALAVAIISPLLLPVERESTIPPQRMDFTRGTGACHLLRG